MEIKKYNIYIILKTGLHIGAWTNNVWIWEMDNPIIKDKNGFPYIPWSSLKWKLRSLYEIKENKIWESGWPYEFKKWEYDEISMFFGKAWKETEWLEQLGPTRFIFRDLKLAEKIDLENIKIESFEKEDLYTFETYKEWQKEWEVLTEEKTEVAINRKTWTAWWKWFAPRPVERVFAWTVFKWELIVRSFEKPDKQTEEENFKKFGEKFSKFKEFLEDDYLGWMWTRGSGQVEIIFEEVK